MKKDTLITGAAALVVASGIALSAKALLAPPPAPAVQEAKEEPVVVRQRILVTTREVQPGEFLNNTLLTWQSIDTAQVQPLSIEQGSVAIKSLRGATVRHPLQAGQALTESQLIRAGDAGFLATVLQPGMRAVSIPTGAVESSFGLISAGDRVDVILSLKGQNSNDLAGMPFLRSQTILRDARVLALNNRINSLAPGGETAGKHEKALRTFSTVTLEVSPKVAERLSIAKELGDLLLALRPLASSDSAVPPNSGITTVSDATDIYRPSEAAPVIKSYRGDALEPVALTE